MRPPPIFILRSTQPKKHPSTRCALWGCLPGPTKTEQVLLPETASMMHSRLAVLIDAENLAKDLGVPLLAAIRTLGTTSIRRIYGDFRTRVAPDWQAFGLAHGFSFRHTPALISGKNAADITLIIDAMDIAHRGLVDGVCIASSDSDFSALALRLREGGLPVYGLVEAKANDRLRAAFNLVMELTAQRPALAPASQPPTKPAAVQPTEPRRVKLTPQTVVNVAGAQAVLLKAFESIRPPQEWVTVQALHQAAVKLQPQFHPSQFGRATIASLVNSLPAFRVETQADGKQRRVALAMAQATGQQAKASTKAQAGSR
jgi:hypothetical protein